MPEAINSIPTRQLTEALFKSDDRLAAAGSFVSPVKLVAGYHAIEFLVITDQMFSLVVEEACRPTGPFVQTASYTSTSVGTQQQLCRRHFPCGPYMRVTLGNLAGDQTFLSFCGTGLPQP